MVVTLAGMASPQVRSRTLTNAATEISRLGEARRHLVQALFHAELGHLHHPARRPAVFRHGQLRLVRAQGLEGDGVALLPREIRRHAQGRGSTLLPSWWAKLWTYSSRRIGSTAR